jgi:hypothetical protein
MPVSPMWRIWEKNLALEPNPFPQKGGESTTLIIKKEN